MLFRNIIEIVTVCDLYCFTIKIMKKETRLIAFRVRVIEIYGDVAAAAVELLVRR